MDLLFDVPIYVHSMWDYRIYSFLAPHKDPITLIYFFTAIIHVSARSFLIGYLVLQSSSKLMKTQTPIRP